MGSTHPTLLAGVAHVLVMRQEFEVRRTNARRLITGVCDFFSSRNVAEVPNPGQAMRAEAERWRGADGDLPVAVTDTPAPEPARISLFHAGPEPNHQVRPASVCGGLLQRVTDDTIQRSLSRLRPLIFNRGITIRKVTRPSIMGLRLFAESFDRLCLGGSHNRLRDVFGVNFSEQGFDGHVRQVGDAERHRQTRRAKAGQDATQMGLCNSGLFGEHVLALARGGEVVVEAGVGFSSFHDTCNYEAWLADCQARLAEN